MFELNKANYDSIKMTNGKKGLSHFLNGGREIHGYLKGDGVKDILEDSFSNLYGQKSADSDIFNSSKDACSIFRPKRLDEKY